MTVRVTSKKGAAVGSYYLEEVGQYYLDGADGTRTWMGRGASALDLEGAVEADDFLAVCDGFDPRSNTSLGRPFNDASVRIYDVTCSAPKSVSLLAAFGDSSVRQQVNEAHDAAVAEVFAWIEQTALTRPTIDGKTYIVDAKGVVGATVREETSRSLDPQLHTHLLISNKVLTSDGRWLALDARPMIKSAQTLTSLYQASLRGELTRRLGIRWEEPEKYASECADIPNEVRHAFSTRSQEAESLFRKRAEDFERSFGRAPDPKERHALHRDAVLMSRPRKTCAPVGILAQEWVSRLVSLGTTRNEFVGNALYKASPITISTEMEDQIVETALTRLVAKQSTWAPPEVEREVAAVLPVEGSVSASEVRLLVDRLARRAEAELMVDISPIADGDVPLRRDGRPITEDPLAQKFTTQAILDQEANIFETSEALVSQGGDPSALLLSRAYQGGAGDVPADAIRLNDAQLEVAASVAGTERLVLVLGPAGTGKTTALKEATDQLRSEGRAVLGVAPSAIAAEVIEQETGIAADTIDKLLIEHRLDRPPDHRFALPEGATVMVDEAGMLSTDKMAELFDLANSKNWRLALIGDPFQFAAIGRGGMFASLTRHFGAIELDEVHRFRNSWESEASLRLRRGDPDVISVYQDNNRIHEGDRIEMAMEVVSRWETARQSGEDAAMMAPTIEGTTLLNEIAQRQRIESGQLDEYGPSVTRDETRILVGDEIATRKNARQIRTNQGRSVKNRDRWAVARIFNDGAIEAVGPTGRVRLDSDYVSEHVELAYAVTSHASQGRTVDRSFLLLDSATDSRGVYVPMTRGRLTNEVFVATDEHTSGIDVLRQSVDRSWIDRPAHEVLEENRPPSPHPKIKTARPQASSPGGNDSPTGVGLSAEQPRPAVVLTVGELKRMGGAQFGYSRSEWNRIVALWPEASPAEQRQNVDVLIRRREQVRANRTRSMSGLRRVSVEQERKYRGPGIAL